MKRSLKTALLGIALVAVSSASADVLYSEDFGGEGTSFSSLGWQVYGDNKVDYSDSTSNPVKLQSTSPYATSGQHGIIGETVENEFVCISDTPIIKSVQRDSALKVSFVRRINWASGEWNWNWFRVLLRVNNNWYASRRITDNTGTTTWKSETLTVSEKIWYDMGKSVLTMGLMRRTWKTETHLSIQGMKSICQMAISPKRGC